MTFDYLQQVVVGGQLDIENIGQTVVLGRNDLGEEFYLVIKTELGFTEVVEYGPAIPDISLLPYSVHFSYNRFEWNQSKLERIIDKFLNNPKSEITQAEVTTIENIRDNVVNFIDKLFPNSKTTE